MQVFKMGVVTGQDQETGCTSLYLHQGQESLGRHQGRKRRAGDVDGHKRGDLPLVQEELRAHGCTSGWAGCHTLLGKHCALLPKGAGSPALHMLVLWQPCEVAESLTFMQTSQEEVDLCVLR